LRNVIAGLNAAAREQVRALTARLQLATPRERALLGALALGFLIILPITTADWRVGEEDRYVDALGDRAQARLAAAAALRVRTALDDKVALEDMKTWGFKASNVDVARVMIEESLSRAAREAELTSPSISTDEEVEAIGPTQWLGAEVQADLRWTPVFGFLDKVAALPEGFRVVAFNYELTPQPVGFRPQPANPDQAPPPSGKVRIRLAFPVDLPAGETASVDLSAGSGRLSRRGAL
jgi:hypothetical protein